MSLSTPAAPAVGVVRRSDCETAFTDQDAEFLPLCVHQLHVPAGGPPRSLPEEVRLQTSGQRVRRRVLRRLLC